MPAGASWGGVEEIVAEVFPVLFSQRIIHLVALVSTMVGEIKLLRGIIPVVRHIDGIAHGGKLGKSGAAAAGNHSIWSREDIAVDRFPP